MTAPIAVFIQIPGSDVRFLFGVSNLEPPAGASIGDLLAIVDDGSGGMAVGVLAGSSSIDADTLDGLDSTDFVLEAEKGAALGVATLGSDAKIPIAQIPAEAITDVFDAASQAAMLALGAQKGDFARRTDLGNALYLLRTNDPTTLANWTAVSSASAGLTRTTTTIITGTIAAGAQETGTIVLAKSSVLLRVVALYSRQCRLRLYGTAAARDADLARAPATSAIAGSATTGTGIAVDLVLSSAEGYDIRLDPKAVLANTADPGITTLYYTIDNLTTGAVPVGLTLYHLPLE